MDVQRKLKPRSSQTDQKRISLIRSRRNILNKKVLSPLRRLRAFVRLVIANISWLIEADNSNKSILNKQHEHRTPEENALIYKIINGFKAFRKYPDNVKMMLASSSHFRCYGPGRVIVRKDHYATAIFVIISGEVNLIKEVYDKFRNETERQVTRVLTVGDIFGEVCLLHDMPRSETIISSSAVEFLMLERAHFDAVLKSTVKQEWDYKSSLMLTFDYFKHWDKIRIGECYTQSLVKRFNKGDTILGDGTGRKNYVHFIIEGSCSLIEHLNVQEMTNLKGVKSYHLVEDGATCIPEPPALFISPGTVAPSSCIKKSGKNVLKTAVTSISRKSMRATLQSRNHIQSSIGLGKQIAENCRKAGGKTLSENTISRMPKVQTVFMQVCIYRQMSCFSLGEPMKNRRVVAEEHVVCLLIPSYLLLGRDNIWARIRQFLTKRIPTQQVVFETFVTQRQWRKYKTGLVKPLISSYCTNWNCNIPYSMRIRMDYEFENIAEKNL